MTSGSFHASYLFQELMILNHDRMINSLVTMYEVLYNGEKMLRGESGLWDYFYRVLLHMINTR